MYIFIGDLLEGLLDFVADLWLVRKLRSRNQRPQNTWAKDAAALAFVEWWVSALLCVAAALGFAVMFYVLGFSFVTSLFFSGVPAGLYGGYRWLRLTQA